MGIIEQRVNVRWKKRVRRVKTLIDTGTEKTLLHPKLASSLKLLDLGKVRLFFGGKIVRLGRKSIVEIGVKNKFLPATVAITKYIDYPLIIGADFLQQRNVVLDYKEDKMIIKTRRIYREGFRV